MSADNWTVCPRCREMVDARNEAAFRAPGEQYGKVSAEEYAKLVLAANSPEKHEDSLREDYEIGMEQTKTGEPAFYVSYKARCECGFQFSHSYEEAINTKPK